MKVRIVFSQGRVVLEGIYNKSAALRTLGAIPSIPTVGAKSPTPFSSTDAAVVSISRNISSVNIEKHIDDYERGKAYLSKSISTELRKKDLQNSFDLAAQDPTAFTSYLLNSTALNYKSKARYIESVSKANETVSIINTASQQDPGAEIMEQFEALKAEAQPAEA